MVSKYKSALEDAQKATKLDVSFVKGHLREAKCHLLFGDITSAMRSLDTVKMLDPNNTSLPQEIKNLEVLKKHIEDAEKYCSKKDYRTALYNINRALNIGTECLHFKLMKAEYLTLLSKNNEAQEIVNDILRFDSLNVEALYIRGMSLYYSDNVEKAFQHFQQVLRLCPDHNKAKDTYRKAKSLMAKKQEGNEAVKNNKLEEAYNLYTNALDIDPLNNLTNAKLYFNRAIVNAKVFITVILFSKE
jgi:DnaJ family protein C protein 7